MFKVLVLVAVCLVAVALGAPQAGRIVGGWRAHDGQFPYQISLLNEGRHACGGSIINNQWILTAAQCVDGYSPEIFTVFAGSTRLTQGGQLYSVQKIIRHPNFNSTTMSNDVAVIKLTNKITFSDLVRSVQLNNGQSIIGLILSGWGTKTHPGGTPDWLQFVHLSKYTNVDCAAALVGLGQVTVTSTNICSSSRAGEGACTGDFGGPLIDYMSNEQVGILSWVYPCAKGKPDVYTRVSSFVGWINQQIQLN